MKKSLEIENKLNRDDLVYKKQTKQIRLKDDVDIFRESTKPNESVKKEKKALTFENAIILFNGRQKVLNDFESRIFSKGKQRKGLTSILDRIACKVKVSDRKVTDCK